MQVSTWYRHAAIAALISASLTPLAAAPASASSKKTAKVLSVDGPAQLTVRSQGKRVKVTLAGIDGPRQGQCGAGAATAELRTLVKGVRGLRVRTFADGKRRVTSTDGRVVASVWYGASRRNPGGATFASELIAAGWGRQGIDASSATPEEIRSTLGDTTSTSDAETVAAKAGKGAWATCGGWMHLPAASAVPSYAPSVWSISPRGITTTIGGTPLNATLAPGSELTLAGVAQQFGAVEQTITSDGCSAWSPTRQLSFVAIVGGPLTGDTIRDAGDCAKQAVFGILSVGPKPVMTDTGVQTGAAVSSLKAAFPGVTDARLRRRESSDTVWLGDEPWRPWAWGTVAQRDGKTITGFSTLVTPIF